MAELKCPHCGKVFTVDESELGSIVKQIRDREFENDLKKRTGELEEHLRLQHEMELKDAVAEEGRKTEAEQEKLREALRQAEKDHERTKAELAAAENRQRIAVLEAVNKETEVREAEVEKLKEDLHRMEKESEAAQEQLREALRKAEKNSEQTKAELAAAENRQRIAVLEAVNKVEEEKHGLESQLLQEKEKGRLLLEQEKERNRILLDEKEKTIEFYKDMKTRMSTKMVGETLEQHCEIQFNQLRATAFRNAYFEKDNDARSGSKGDYIYREKDENGTEIISIMFEMKNEMDETATKHKNEDFFKELDKDRKEKDCEYAVLVSMLESDNELYNAGIVDVSYRYDKMYVVRPQCFIPIITLLRNAALNSLTYKQELAAVRNQNIDISNFEDSLLRFKDDFSKNYEHAHNHFNKAIEEIDKTIQHLQKVKDELLGSDNQLRIANNKIDSVTVKKLTKNNPTMKEMFAREAEKKKAEGRIETEDE